MADDKGRLVIHGIQENGKKFRPSDWVERISATLASFGPDHRLRYARSVQPCLINGERCLVVERDLAEKDPEAFAFILGFAKSNRLRIQEDRRNNAREADTAHRAE